MIAIDLRMLHASGIGTVIQNLVPLVISLYSNIKFYLLGKRRDIELFSWAYNENTEIINCNSSIYTVSEQIELFRKIPKNISLFWSPHYNIPIFYSGKLLVTVHDVFHIAMPEYIDGLHRRLYARGMFVALKHKANKIICDSQFTSNELMRLTGIDSSKIRVIYPGVDAMWFSIQKKARPHLKPYLLFVGNVKPHKNLVRLVEAYEILMEKIPHDLVIVGKKEGFITEDKVVQEKALKLNHRIHFTGYVTDNLLRQYFMHADTLVLPSLYEGFGLPALEAMACGCPVVASNAASLPEVCGDAAYYVAPDNIESITDGIYKVITDETLRKSLSEKGFERAKLFNWEKSAKEHLKVFEDVLNSW